MARVLLVHRYFWPDSPAYASILRFIARRLGEDGHEVTVLSCQPSYRPGQAPAAAEENLDGFRVQRLSLLRENKKAFLRRLVNLGLFAFKVRREIRRHSYDVVMAATTPPVLIGRMALGAARKSGAAFVYHCQDIHPEALGYSGLLRLKGMVFKVLRWMDRSTVARADRIVVLSSDMAATLESERRLPDAGRVRVMNNFQPQMAAATEEGTAPSADQDRPVRIMFTGNLGYFQGLDVVIDAVRGLASDQLELVFVGDGAAKGALMDRAGDLVDRRIRFIPHQPVDALPELLATADLGLVSLAPNIIRVAYPSKTMTYLELGCPLLAVVETDTELARLIRNHDIGFVTPPGDVTALQDAFAQVISRRGELAAMRPRARDVARQAFDQTRLLDQWSALYGELVAERRAA